MPGGCDAGSSGPGGCHADPCHASNAGPDDAATASCGRPCVDGTDDDGWSASGDSNIQNYKDSLQSAEEASGPGHLPTGPGSLSAGSGAVSAGDLLSGAGDLSADLHSASVLPDSQLPLVGFTGVSAVKFEQPI